MSIEQFCNYEFNKLFNSIDLKHQIEISILEDISWFNINKIDYECCKTFLILLKDVLTYLSKKNVKYIKQYIVKDDIELFKSSTFIESSNNTFIVNTKIEEFVPEIVNVLGINKL